MLLGDIHVQVFLIDFPMAAMFVGVVPCLAFFVIIKYDHPSPPPGNGHCSVGVHVAALSALFDSKFICTATFM